MAKTTITASITPKTSVTDGITCNHMCQRLQPFTLEVAATRTGGVASSTPQAAFTGAVNYECIELQGLYASGYEAGRASLTSRAWGYRLVCVR